MSKQAEQARQALGARLREIRKDAQLSGRALAALAGWHPSKITQLELGKRGPSEKDLRAWALHCGAEDQLADLIATVRGIDSAYVEWRRQLRTGLRRRQEASASLYERAALLRIYQPGVPPALLQTAEYAEAVLRSRQRFRDLPDDVMAAVTARMDRQRVLYFGGRRFLVVLEEQVLLTRFGDDKVMAGQLDRLLDVMGMQRVSLGIIPAAGPRLIGPGEGFVVFDNELVRVETTSAQLTVTQPAEVAVYAHAFAAMQAAAVYGAEARALVEVARARLSI
ncbi:helix-turn-helix transcriptional regulator [Streptosporangium sp. NPDC000239]|uniref:helix-turn-helix domain-containing protein n=1 Tax=Streptosporangium sp. NPDC000239 TaxID=3154248 RepID=UPI00332B6F2C